MEAKADEHSAKSILEAQLHEILSESNADAIKRESSAFDDLTSPFNKSIVLFGAGGLGRKTLAGLRRVGLEPLAFADNNSLLWEKEIDGLQVLSPNEAARQYGKSASFVVTIWRAGGGHRFHNTRQQLQNLNCLKVVSFVLLFWKFHEFFLPYYAISLPHTLYNQSNEIIQAFELWANGASCSEYIAQLRFRFRADFDGLSSPAMHAQYFPDDLYELSTDEMFIDCGAYDGDTFRIFLERQPKFRGKITALEPDPGNLKKLQRNVDTLSAELRKRISILPCAVGMRHETVRFAATGTASSVINSEGSLEVNCVRLDDVIRESRPTFIKMDVEGAELDALRGARRLIEKNLPILAISVYHQADHLWRIPLLIHSYSEDYRFFLRPHNEEGWDLICYAVPVNRLII